MILTEKGNIMICHICFRKDKRIFPRVATYKCPICKKNFCKSCAEINNYVCDGRRHLKRDIGLELLK